MVEGEVASEIDGLRRALGASALQRIAPHITLVPPTNVPPRLPPPSPADPPRLALHAHVRQAAASVSPIPVVIGPPATFLPETPVLYLRLDGDLGPLHRLQGLLASGVLAPPAGRPARAFVPHVTLDQAVAPELVAQALVVLGHFGREYVFERVTVLEQQADRRWLPVGEAPLGPLRPVNPGTLDLAFSVVRHLDPELREWADELWAGYTRSRYGPDVVADEPFAVVAHPAGIAEGHVRGEVCHLGRLVVRADWRFRGLGSRLLRAVERHGLDSGCAIVRLETAAGADAMAFYERRGYAPVAALPAWRHGQDFLVMERSVRSASGQSPE